MAKLGFLGLGIMGYPMARNLIRAGHDVAVWSHNSGKAKKLAQEEKGKFCATPKEVGAHAEAIFLCVGDTAMVENVLLGADGVAAGAKAGSVVADASTIGPSDSRAIGAALGAKGIEFLDAPCTGSRAGAEGGTLTFMIGGKQEVFERLRPYFEAMGKRLYYCGSAGMGLHAKLSQNMILSNLLQAFNESMVLAVKAGVDPGVMLDILDNSAAKSAMIAAKAPAVFKRDFTPPNFSVKWMHKDVGLMIDSAKELGVPVPLTAITHQMLQTAIAEGLGEDDMCSSIKVLERMAKVEVKKA
jgi:3-hydroxyisobutyrate dehydrogenase-like beta-hydroxyacid dehydrogenase